jgi:biopolymer transport protein ExbD
MLKRRSKASAEFSLASMTDMIFLLLIFFVLTSNVVKISDMELPESDSKTVASPSAVIEVASNGKYRFNGQELSLGALKSAVARQQKEATDKKEFTMTIAADKETPFDEVTPVIKIAGELRIKAILATQPKQQ